jgi:hypothetical protein
MQRSRTHEILLHEDLRRLKHNTWFGGRMCAILDGQSSQRSTDLLLFLLAHPRWEMLFQPKYAAYFCLIEPWWKIVHSFALAAWCFESCNEIAEAIH